MNEPTDTPRTGMPETVTGLVVVGASAGGIDAVRTLVSSLPADFPAALVIAQHLDPHRPSHLGDLLASQTSLQVRTASAHDTLQPGTVYVVPTDRDVEVSDHHVGLYEDQAGVSRPSIDRLMMTAAGAFGENLAGVVLSGTGADGAAGAQAIKEHGGTVIVQDPATADYPGMPASVPPSAIDVVAGLDQIGPTLVNLFSDAYTLPAVTNQGEDDGMRDLLDHVREQTGLDFGTYKRATIDRRLQRRMATVGTTSLGAYHRYVQNHPEELQRLTSSFLIKVTRFYRDPALYASLREDILPTLIAAAEEQGELRLWSAGCATGEEAYTLAMLVVDLLEAEQKTLRVRVFATDVAADAINFARQGVYPESALTDMPADMIERHFVRHDGTYEVLRSVRGLVVFGEHDLGQRAPFPRIDLVLCRNVLIYFTPELQRRALQLFAFSLRPDGYLVLGKAESVSPLPDFFTLEQPRLKVFRRVGTPSPIPVDRILDTSSFRPVSPRPGRRPPVAQTGDGPSRAPGQPSPTEAAPLLDQLATGVAIVDRHYDIQSINVTARRLLGIHGAGPGADIVHSALPVLADGVRAGIDAALRDERTTRTLQVPLDVVEDGGRDLLLTCTPARADGERAAPDTVMLEIAEVTRMARDLRDLTRERDEAREESRQLREHATATVNEMRELRMGSQAMAAEQGRLRVENEQLQLSSEEAQAAAEEIETLNEEQQASNEELETLNEELQATVDELNTANAELQARALEQEELAANLASERAESDDERTRLAAILANMGDAVLVVDAGGNVMQANDAWKRMLGPAENFAPEDTAGLPLPRDAWPRQRALAGEELILAFALPNASGERRWFEAHAQPVYLTDHGLPWGVVVVREITERNLRMLQEQFLAVVSHELRTPLTALSGSLQLMERRMPEGDTGEWLASHIRRAQTQLRRLNMLVGELSDVARIRGGAIHLEWTSIDLAAVVREAVAAARYLDDGEEIRIDTSPDPVTVWGDADRLQQVVLNLITNACRHAATPQGIDIRLRRDEDEASVEVQDYGPGIPEDVLPEIFSRFYQSDGETPRRVGLGLGLYIARELMTAHGGTIRAKSTVGEGTTFEVRLPVSGEGEPAGRTALPPGAEDDK